MSRRQLAVYSKRDFTEEAVEVGAQSYKGRGPEKGVSRRQLVVYSRGGAEEDAGGRRRGEERRGERGEETGQDLEI